MIPALAFAYFAAGAISLLALQLIVRAVRRLLGMASAAQKAEALRDAAQKRADDAEARLGLAECALATQGKPSPNAPASDERPRVTARRIER